MAMASDDAFEYPDDAYQRDLQKMLREKGPEFARLVSLGVAREKAAFQAKLDLTPS